MNIFMLGVGGQGIGLMSECLIRAVDHAGLRAKGVDTHGLAQRGGTVTSHLRIESDGDKVFSPMVSPKTADVVIALERHEAYRGLVDWVKPGGIVVYYDVELQPLAVRTAKAARISREKIELAASETKIKLLRVFSDKLVDPRMQNVAVLGAIARSGVIAGVSVEHFEKAMSDLMDGQSLEKNLEVFRAS